jgi:hypothetical protein
MSDATDADDERFTALVEAYIAYLEGHKPPPSLDHLDPDTRREARSVFRAINVAWHNDIDLPALEDDPVAQTLGFTLVPTATSRPESSAASQTTPGIVVLSGPKIAAARRRSRLKPSEITRKLHAGGVQVEVNWVFRVEGAPATTTPEPIAAALAQVLGVAILALTARASDPVDPFATWLYSSDFDAEIRFWARQKGRRDLSEIAEQARGHLLAVAKRSSGEGERDQWASMLHAVLDELA